MTKQNKTDAVTLRRGLLQAAFFLAAADFSDKLTIATKVRSALGSTLDGDPVILPIPDDAPSEFPRISLSSKNKIYTCNISPLRIDFLIDISKIGDEIGDADIDELFLKFSSLMSKVIFSQLNWNINRLALICQSKAELGKSGVEYLQPLVESKIGKDSKELQLHRLKVLQVNKFNSNHWLRIISEEESLIILSDINTSQYEKYEMDADSSEAFFSESLKITEESIKVVI